MCPMQLPRRTIELLTALGSDRLSGRELAHRYREEYSRTISYGSLYTLMARLHEQGWVTQEDSEDEDGRLRYFRITGDGAKNLRAVARDLDRFSARIKEQFA